MFRISRPISTASAVVRLVSAIILSAALGLGGGAVLAQSAQAPEVAAPSAAERAEIAPLLDALGLNDLLPIMRTEGLAYSEDLAFEMFPGRGGARWEDMVDRIYRVERMRDVMTDEMAGALEPGQIDALMQFFGSELGRRIVRLEISAREALIDDGVEAASEDALAAMRADQDPRLDVLAEFIATNDLIEMNVVGALNSNFAFYLGLDSGGAFDGALSEEDMLRDVWSQEAEIRTDTTDWVFSYLGMAYQPLSDDDIKAYTALSATPEGRALNTALFNAFDVMFTTISRDLGQAAATFMSGEDI